jgi:hypothetical protein
MPKTVNLLGSTQGVANLVGEKQKADGWYGHTDGLHTVAIYTQNFTGRVILEGTISLEPTEDDWFPIALTDTSTWMEFPRNPMAPTGDLGGDNGVVAFTFRMNVVWLRASVDRSYLPQQFEGSEDIAAVGVVRKIVLSR